MRPGVALAPQPVGVVGFRLASLSQFKEWAAESDLAFFLLYFLLNALYGSEEFRYFVRVHAHGAQHGD
jgi:hypothetical protein